MSDMNCPNCGCGILGSLPEGEDESRDSMYCLSVRVLPKFSGLALRLHHATSCSELSDDDISLLRLLRCLPKELFQEEDLEDYHAAVSR